MLYGIALEIQNSVVTQLELDKTSFSLQVRHIFTGHVSIQILKVMH